MVLTDGQWAALEPLIEAARPKGKTPPRDLRRTLEAIVRRHRNGATWRAIPAELGPWWRGAQLFIRGSFRDPGCWDRGSRDERPGERGEEGLPPPPGVVDHLEEGEVGGQLLPRDAPV